jgi:hypothetical protein
MFRKKKWLGRKPKEGDEEEGRVPSMWHGQMQKHLLLEKEDRSARVASLANETFPNQQLHQDSVL